MKAGIIYKNIIKTGAAHDSMGGIYYLGQDHEEYEFILMKSGCRDDIKLRITGPLGWDLPAMDMGDCEIEIKIKYKTTTTSEKIL